MERFDDNVRSALGMEVQQAALRRATDLFSERRQAALQQAPDWELWRAHGRAVKDHTLQHLDRYLEQFAAAAEQRGTVLHWAADAAEACAVVTRLVQDAGGKLVVKSKSMTTEEIDLNSTLEAAGIETVETDLGEWIIQLAGETPSHIIVPAIHKTEAQIAALFADKLGSDGHAKAKELTAVARQRLRDCFARADVGISGANFLIAETGSLLILENEGNARFSTSLPRCHIAVVGIEKLIPRLADLDVFLQLLPRSGTGQQMTTYQSLLTGPVPAGQEGPQQLHVVLLDNGRSRMLKQPVTRQSLACIRCGACLNACPVYQQIGGHAYGSVYPGPIGAVITPQLMGMHKAQQLPFASTLCGACRDVCPMRIDIPELLLHLRQGVMQGEASVPAAAPHRLQALLFWSWALLVSGRRRYAFAAAVGRLVQRLCPWLLRWLPPTSRWAKGRELPRLAAQDFRTLWRRQEAKR